MDSRVHPLRLALVADYFVRPQPTANATVIVSPGKHVKSDGSGFVEITSPTTSPAFAAVSGAGKERYDLLVVDDSGNLAVAQGSEVTAGSGSPFANAPAFPSDKLAIAIIKIDESASVVIDAADITDAREFLSKGGGGGGGSTTTPSVLVSEKQVMTAGQTVVTLASISYDTGHAIIVTKNGQVLNQDEYTKTSSSVVTLAEPAASGEVIEVYALKGVSDVAVDYQLFQNMAVGTTVLNLSFSYVQGIHQIEVRRNGNVQIATQDYTETSTNSITLTNAITSTSEKIEVIKFQAVTGSASGGGDPNIIAGFTQDLEIRCDNNNQVVIKSGSKVGLDDGSQVVNLSSDITVDITTSGANGLDTGSEAANTWYYIYLIWDGSNAAGLLSTSYTSPTLPAGYTAKRLLGAVRNNGGSNFVWFRQINRDVQIQTQLLASSVNATSYTSVAVSPAAPVWITSQIHLWGWSRIPTGNTSTGTALYLSADSAGNFYAVIQQGDAVTSGNWSIKASVPPLTLRGSVFYFRCGDSYDRADIYCMGYKLSI